MAVEVSKPKESSIDIISLFCCIDDYLLHLAGLFSFKNYQLMSVTDSLFRPSGRAVAKPIGVNLVVFQI